MNAATEVISLFEKTLSLDDIRKLACDFESKIKISAACEETVVKNCRELENHFAKGLPIYGLNTGLGDLVRFPIDASLASELQRNLVYSHSVGVGAWLPPEIGRAILLLRLKTLSQGVSGVRPSTIELMTKVFNSGIAPLISSQGSLGASGDLGPLSNLALFLMGKGNASHKGRAVNSLEAFEKLGIDPLILGPKEGLSLINGTSAMTAVAAFSMSLIPLYVNAYMSLYSAILHLLEFHTGFLAPTAFRYKPHQGAARIVNLLNMLIPQVNISGSPTAGQHVYSFRCLPYILSPLIETFRSSKDVIEIEANSVSDNPLLLDGDVYHGGHFHGHPVSVALDQMRIALVHMSGIIDRQLEYIVDNRRNTLYPPFLALSPSDGYCGLEGAQYLVTSLHAENKVLASPWSLQTVPSNAGNQDYVSMGLQSALALQTMMSNLSRQLSVYALAALQANAMAPDNRKIEWLSAFAQRMGISSQLPYSDKTPVSELIEILSSPVAFENIINNISSGKDEEYKLGYQALWI